MRSPHSTRKNSLAILLGSLFMPAAVAVWLGGCSQAPKAAVQGTKKMPADQEFSGFLKNYQDLKPNAEVGGDARTYLNPDKMKSLRRYVAIIVDPVDVYVASNADDSQIPTRAREVV